MKLRSKKTGEIKDFGNLQVYAETENTDESQLLGNFDSFGQIFEYYEDYTPKEPLIKDPKIRKAVRAWAEANDVEKLAVLCHSSMEESVTEIAKIDNASLRIVFSGDLGIKRGYTFTDYTITELCGEEL